VCRIHYRPTVELEHCIKTFISLKLYSCVSHYFCQRINNDYDDGGGGGDNDDDDDS